MITYLHADDTAYVRAIGPQFLISAVARIYKPGCKVDNAPIYEGPQGQGKSTALRKLAVRDEWFTDRLSHLGSKDAALETAGVWFVEIAELASLTRSTTATSKRFISAQYDRVRPPYARHIVKLPRQCVFAGTINPPAGGCAHPTRPAIDVSGQSTCHGMIDIDGIEHNVDQLWAEAVVRFRAGDRWWLETPELEALATAEQRARYKRDVWTEVVEAWIGDCKDVGISEILEGALGLAPNQQTHSAEIRVANILTHLLGYEKYRPGKGKDPTRRPRYSRK